MTDDICPRCDHLVESHNDAGSAPVDLSLAAGIDGFIPQGQMCCYSRPGQRSPGLANWFGKVCGCSYAGPGTRRFH